MPTQDNSDDRIALLQGTLDLLILKTLLPGPCHGQGVARSIQRQSEEELFVDHGSLYLALQRLEDQKLVGAKWGQVKIIAKPGSIRSQRKAGPNCLTTRASGSD